MKVRGRGDRTRFAMAAAALLFALAAIEGTRALGWLERLELAVHDSLLDLRATPQPSPDVAVVLESEGDLQRFGHPLSDARLAEAIGLLRAHGAAAIGVDKYRDKPVEPGQAELDRVLAANPEVIWVTTFGDGPDGGVQPPAMLRGTERAACGDIIGDADGRVRRVILYLDDGTRQCRSLAFAVAGAYLRTQGKSLRLDAAQGGVIVRAGGAPIAAMREGSGPYATADTAGFQVPLQFRRPAIAVIRFGDLLDGKVAPASIRGRAIFLGSDAASLRDLFEVPQRAATLDGRLPGATLHAHAAAELIDATRDPSTFLELSAPWVGHALLVVSAATVALAVVLLHSFALGLLATLAVLLAMGAGAAVAALTGLAIPPLPAALGALLTCFAALGLRAWREKRERNELMGFFGRQVSPQVAALIWENREAFFDHGRIPAQSVNVSVLFADIRSYSTITEQLEPQALIDWLNCAIGAMTEAVQRNGGVVVRYVGDQVMALYGSPVPSMTRQAMSRDAIAAVRTGLDMGRLLDAANATNQQRGLPATRVRVGVHSGPVIQGGLGTRERFEFTVLGDTVNTAARLESYATEDDGVTARLLIGGATLALCDDRFAIEGLGALQLKGKAQTVEVYRVFSEKLSREGTSDEGNALVSGRDGPVPGGSASRAGAGSGQGG